MSQPRKQKTVIAVNVKVYLLLSFNRLTMEYAARNTNRISGDIGWLIITAMTATTSAIILAVLRFNMKTIAVTVSSIPIV